MKNCEVLVSKPGDEKAAIALSAFIHGMAETQSVAIVKYIKRKNSEPKLAVLVPAIKPVWICIQCNFQNIDLLYINILPFSEDLRQYPFYSLLGENAKFKPNNQQLEAVENLIDHMDLMNAERDEDGF